MFRRAARLAALLLALAPLAAQAQPAPRPELRPELRIIGGPAGGCIAGAAELPPEGPGYITIRRTRSFFYGAPSTVAALQLLAREAEAAGFPTLYMNDISKPRGGPFPGIHASHMLGLDADVWLDLGARPALTPAARDALAPASLVRPDGRNTTADWTPWHTRLVRLATELPGVDRVLVNPAIKQQLCDTAGPDRAWLRRVRPWFGHASHMHIHFRCPPNQPECTDQAPPPPGDGCDATLAWWFEPHDAPPPKPPAAPRLPAACAAILAGQ